MIESNLSFGICMYQFSIWNELTYKISRNVVGCHQRICLAVLVYHSHAICGKLWIEITHVWCRTIWIWTTIFSMLTKRPDWSVLVHRMLMADGKSIAHYYHRRSVDGFRWRRNDGVTTTASAFFFVAQQTNRRKRVIQLELSTPPKPDTFVRFIFCFLLLFLLLLQATKILLTLRFCFASQSAQIHILFFSVHAGLKRMYKTHKFGINPRFQSFANQ